MAENEKEERVKVYVSLTEEEFSALDEAAKRASLTRGAFVMRAVTGKKMTKKTTVGEVLMLTADVVNQFSRATGMKALDAEEKKRARDLEKRFEKVYDVAVKFGLSL
ncbi:MAG: hypothetical protein LUD29_00945 [Clostridia bacterium]|nr:hypothetical protein [Clostridia bacterium]